MKASSHPPSSPTSVTIANENEIYPLDDEQLCAFPLAHFDSPKPPIRQLCSPFQRERDFLACGTGLISSALLNHFTTICGIDVSPHILQVYDSRFLTCGISASRIHSVARYLIAKAARPWGLPTRPATETVEKASRSSQHSENRFSHPRSTLSEQKMAALHPLVNSG